MNETIQKRNKMLQNETKLVSEICSKCTEENLLEANDRIKEYMVNDIYLYALNNDTNSIMESEGIILSPTKLDKITNADFEEEEFFSEVNNCIGYKTKIENGFWILCKNNEIRYTLKSGYKKIAVIQIKKNHEYSIEQNVFSYSSRVENEIKENLNNSKNIMDTLMYVISEDELQDELQDEVSSIKEDLENKSLKLLIKEWELISKQTENMNINITKDLTQKNRALVILNNDQSFAEKLKKAWIKLVKILNSNVFEGKNNTTKARR